MMLSVKTAVLRMGLFAILYHAEELPLGRYYSDQVVLWRNKANVKEATPNQALEVTLDSAPQGRRWTKHE